MILSLSKLVREVSLDDSNQNKEIVKILSNNIACLKDMKEKIIKISKISPWLSCLPGYSILEMEREQIRGNIEELKRDVETVSESYGKGDLPQFKEFMQDINKVGDELA